MWSISLYVIPFVTTIMYRRGAQFVDNVVSLGGFAAGASVILFASLVARGYSRVRNPIYLKFMKTLNDAKAHYSFETKQELHKYEFEFWAWPVDFQASAG